MNAEKSLLAINIIKGLLSIVVLISALFAIYRGRVVEAETARDRVALLHLINVVEKDNIGEGNK